GAAERWAGPDQWRRHDSGGQGGQVSGHCTDRLAAHRYGPWGYLVVAANGDPALAGPAISFLASGGCRYGAHRHGTARPSRHWQWPPGPPASATPQCLSRPGGSGVTAFPAYPG